MKFRESFINLALILLITGCNIFDDNESSINPVRYDLREEGLITSVKCQCGFTSSGESDIGTSVGVCWAFSSLASLESSLLKEGIIIDTQSEGANLSCWYLGNYINYNIPCYMFNDDVIPGVEPPTSFGYYFPGYGWGGGGAYWTGDYLTAGKELPTWAEVPMPSEDMSAHNTLTVPETADKQKYQIKDMIILLSMDFNSNDKFRQAVKNYIRRNGAIQGMVHLEPIDYENITRMEANGIMYEEHRFMDLTNYNMFTYESENLTTIPLTHAVTIAGWDDNREIDIDGHETQGGWLIKDSQGIAAWNDGYFWVAYEDLYINCFASGLIACDPDLYQHQSKYQTHPGALSKIFSDEYFEESTILELGEYSYLLNGNQYKDSWAVAQFELEENEELCAAGLFTVNRNQELTINIYKNSLNNSPLFTKDFTLDEIGYHLLELGISIPFAVGETIIIGVKFKYDTAHNRLPLVYVRDLGHEIVYPTFFGSYTGNEYQLFPYSELGNECCFYLQAVVGY